MVNLYEYDTTTEEECINDLDEIIEFSLNYEWTLEELDALEKKGKRIQYIAQRLKELAKIGGKDEKRTHNKIMFPKRLGEMYYDEVIHAIKKDRKYGYKHIALKFLIDGLEDSAIEYKRYIELQKRYIELKREIKKMKGE